MPLKEEGVLRAIFGYYVSFEWLIPSYLNIVLKGLHKISLHSAGQLESNNDLRFVLHVEVQVLLPNVLQQK